MVDIACDIMFGRLAEIKEKVLKEVEKFRQKGAVSPEKAISIKELGLSPEFKGLMAGPLGLLGVFVEVDNKYYLSEERLKEVEEQLSSRPIRRWLRHTASVPKGLLRFYVLKLLKDKPMSGSEIMEEVKKQTGGQWKPSPGSVYPLLTWLRENSYAKELPREVTGIKRYMLTEKGTKFFEEHANFEDKLRKKIGTMAPMFFLRMGLHADGLQELQEPARRFVTAIINLWVALRENLTEQALNEVEQFLNDASEKIGELNEKIMRR
ncbi:MAG: PadR family transcriptional regulator [Candidatus Bathyarchaeota archaeon]|nr:PadR family transcriptional regulator [Candidatus Bathyarchaeota archaeon]